MLKKWLSLGFVVALFLTLGMAGKALAFTDVPGSNPYFIAILDLSSRGIINGFSDGTFKPDALVTRQEFAKMIDKALYLPVSAADICPFPDVQANQDPTDPLYPDHYVAVSAKNGISKGYDDGTFRPSVNIPRYQVVTMVVRAVENLYPGVLATSGLSDSLDGLWAGLPSEHVANAEVAENNGLLYGLEIGPGGAASDPRAAMPRGEVAQVLFNVEQIIPPDFPALSYSGQGNQVVKLTKPAGPALLYAQGGVPGTAFKVEAFDGAGIDEYQGIDALGPYRGISPLDFSWEPTVRLQVTATGPWSIEVRPLSTARVVGTPGTISGSGDEVFRVAGQAVTAYIQGNASGGSFGVSSYDLAGDWRSNPVVTNAPYEGTVVLAGPGLIEVAATGLWSFTTQP